MEVPRVFVRGEGCLDVALRFLWHDQHPSSVTVSGTITLSGPAAEGQGRLVHGSRAMGTARVGQAGASVLPGQHHGRAGGDPLGRSTLSTGGTTRARTGGQQAAMGAGKWVVPAARCSVCAGWRAAGSVSLTPERELTPARSRSKRQAEVKSEPTQFPSLQSAPEHPAAWPWSPSPSRNTSAPWTPPPCPASSGFAPVSTSKVSAGCPLPAKGAHLPPSVPPQPGLPSPAFKMAGPLPPRCSCPGRGTGPRATVRRWCLRHSCLQKTFSSAASAHPAECPSAFGHAAREVVGHQKPSTLVLPGSGSPAGGGSGRDGATG